MPLWGNGEINFQYPTEDIYARRITDGHALRSISFKSLFTWPIVISSVQVHYTNGHSSPVFEKEIVADEYGFYDHHGDNLHSDHETINLNTALIR